MGGNREIFGRNPSMGQNWYFLFAILSQQTLYPLHALEADVFPARASQLADGGRTFHGEVILPQGGIEFPYKDVQRPLRPTRRTRRQGRYDLGGERVLFARNKHRRDCEPTPGRNMCMYNRGDMYEQISLRQNWT